MLAQQRGRRTGVGGHLDYFSTIYQVLPRLEGLLTDEYLRELAAYVNSFDRVFATGVAKSGQPAFLLEQLMFKTNRFFHASLGIVCKQNLFGRRLYVSICSIKVKFGQMINCSIDKGASVSSIQDNLHSNHGHRNGREHLARHFSYGSAGNRAVAIS